MKNIIILIVVGLLLVLLLFVVNSVNRSTFAGANLTFLEDTRTGLYDARVAAFNDPGFTYEDAMEISKL